MTNRKKEDLQNITHETKDRVTRTPLNTWGKLMCAGSVVAPVLLLYLQTRCLYRWLFLYPNSLRHHILPSSLDTLSSYYKRFGIYYNPVKWEKCSACTYFVSNLSDIYRKETYWFNLQIRSWLRVLDLFHFKIKLNGDFLFFKYRTLSSSFIYLCTLLSSTTLFWKQYP